MLAAYLILGFKTLSAQSFDSKVSEVVVYKTKARETRYIKVPIKETGRQEIVLTNISKNIDPASLQVGITGARLISASTKLNYLASPSSGKMIKIWQDSLEVAEDQLGWMKEQLAVYQGELKQLSELIKVDGDETAAYTKAAEDMLNLYRSRSLKIREILYDLQKEEKKLQQQVNNLRQQINAQGNNSLQPVQEVTLVIEASKTGDIQVKCQYLVTGASWEPVYNLRAAALDQPIQVEMMAIVRQYTGYDWDNVQLTLSTSDPSANQSRPIMTPEYIDFFRQYNVTQLESVVVTSGRANMAYPSKAKQSDSDVDGVDDFYDVEPIETSTAQLYTFKGPQQIKTGKEDQKILVNTITMPAEFIYHTVPKKDQTAYLIAKIPQWEQYDLLTGQASIFFEETYVGNTTINPKVVSDTLLLSMGRDELISIERKSIKEVSSTKLLGTSKREVKVFEINIKNNKKSEARIEVLDQIPVSRQNDIIVELESQDGAEYTAENGRLKWILTLKPGESKKIRFSYTLKYPANQQIIIRN